MLFYQSKGISVKRSTIIAEHIFNEIKELDLTWYQTLIFQGHHGTSSLSRLRDGGYPKPGSISSLRGRGGYPNKR